MMFIRLNIVEIVFKIVESKKYQTLCLFFQSIRMLQQKLIDMKKTLQEELKSNIDNSAKSNNSGKVSEEDINYKYLKHVLVKFLTSSEHEVCVNDFYNLFLRARDIKYMLHEVEF